MNLKSSLITAAILSAASLSPRAFAQPVPGLRTVMSAAHEQRIQLQNVSPSMMAWWLDPDKHPEPVQMRGSRDNRQANPLIADKANPDKEIPALPADIARIETLDSQNALLVVGTEAGLSELAKVVALLDKPLRQVEVQGQFVVISPEDAKSLGISISSDPKKRYSAFPLNAGTLARIAALKTQNKISVLSTPRVLAIENLTAAISSRIGQPVFIDIAARLEPGGAAVKLIGADSLMLVTTNSTFTVTPTIVGDNSLQLQLAPARILQLEQPQFSSRPLRPWNEDITPAQMRDEMRHNPTPSPISLRALEGALTTVNVKDGETFALTGFNSHFFSSFMEDDKNPAQNVIILVTPHIVRRAED